MFHGYGIIDKAIDVLDEKEKDDFKYFINNYYSFNRENMFICRSKKLMNEYFLSVFTWLEKCEQIFGFDLKGYAKTRVYTFLAERYISYWFNKYSNPLCWPIFFFDTNKNKLTQEIKRLETIQKRETNSSRQHFLQLSLPGTYIDLIEAGITDDYTMGYASHLGFRAGIANSFLFYNLDTEQIMPINVHPFSISDDILRSSLKLDPINVVDNIAQIIDEVKQVNGTLISLWHNDTFSNIGIWKGWRNVYEDMLKQIQI